MVRHLKCPAVALGLANSLRTPYLFIDFRNCFAVFRLKPFVSGGKRT